MSTTIQVGQSAPDFTLFSSDKQDVSLSSFKGKKVLLLFFPQAFTGTCTQELCMMRDDIARYSNANAEVFGISVDSLFTLARFREENKLPFQLLSDFNKEVSQQYGAFYDEFVFGMKGVSKRAAFVVNEQGIITYAEVLEKASDLPNFEKVNAALN